MLVHPRPMCPDRKFLDVASLGQSYFAPDRTIPSHPFDLIERSDTRHQTAARFSAAKRWSSMCGPSVHLRRRGANPINLVMGVGEAAQMPHWSIRRRRPTEATIAADGATSMLDAVQGRDTSDRDTISMGRFVQGAQHPRIFVWGHIGRGHINPASHEGFIYLETIWWRCTSVLVWISITHKTEDGTLLYLYPRHCSLRGRVANAFLQCEESRNCMVGTCFIYILFTWYKIYTRCTTRWFISCAVVVRNRVQWVSVIRRVHTWQ